LIYTPLKRKTAFCTLLGAFPGAVPPLIGWAGASGGLNSRAWLLFAILFLWQFPHFLAIALMYREDYQRAGFHMLFEFDHDARFAHFEIVAFTIALVATTLLPVPGLSHGILYVLAMSAAGSFFLAYAVRLRKSSSRLSASHLLHASVAYLPVVLMVMMIFKP
jgi:protoheme IX farnesyltransferase